MDGLLRRRFVFSYGFQKGGAFEQVNRGSSALRRDNRGTETGTRDNSVTIRRHFSDSSNPVDYVNKIGKYSMRVGWIWLYGELVLDG
jgi:hypothetical protein